jgi:hypothetical protein
MEASLHKRTQEVFTMASFKAPPHDYRIENVDPAKGSLLPPSSSNHVFADYSLAVAVAVKSVADPTRQEVRVVHIPSGEIVFRTSGAGQAF